MGLDLSLTKQRRSENINYIFFIFFFQCFWQILCLWISCTNGARVEQRRKLWRERERRQRSHTTSMAIAVRYWRIFIRRSRFVSDGIFSGDRSSVVGGLVLHGSSSASARQRSLRRGFVRRSFDGLVDGKDQLRSLRKVQKWKEVLLYTRTLNTTCGLRKRYSTPPL